MRQLSEQLSPPVNLHFSFDSEEPVGTVRLLTLQDVALNWMDTCKVCLNVRHPLPCRTGRQTSLVDHRSLVLKEQMSTYPTVLLIHIQLI